jgi:hypothetical protein
MSELTAEVLYVELNRLGEDWANKDADWKAADAATKGILSLCMDKINDGKASMAYREARARQDPQYQEHLNTVSMFLRDAALARMHYENYKTYVDLLRTKSANRRAEMNLR